MEQTLYIASISTLPVAVIRKHPTKETGAWTFCRSTIWALPSIAWKKARPSGATSWAWKWLVPKPWDVFDHYTEKQFTLKPQASIVPQHSSAACSATSGFGIISVDVTGQQYNNLWTAGVFTPVVCYFLWIIADCLLFFCAISEIAVVFMILTTCIRKTMI